MPRRMHRTTFGLGNKKLVGTALTLGALMIAATTASADTAVKSKKKKAATPAAATTPDASPASSPSTTPAAAAKPAAAGAAAPLAPADGAPAGAPAPAPDEPPPSADSFAGVNENPDAPKVPVDPDAPKAVVVVKRPTGYPIEEALRPITLPKYTSEVSLGISETLNPSITNATLRGRFGLTNQWQLGITYNVGGLFDNGCATSAGCTSKITFNTGKSFGVDVTYLLTDWVGVSATVPVYVDPFAIGLDLGAPLKFTFGDKFAVGGLNDFVDIRLHSFVPSLTDQSVNSASAVQANTHTSLPKGSLNFVAYGIYQIQSNLALIAQLGGELVDFSSQNTVYPLNATIQISPVRTVDLSLTAGWQDLNNASSSFGFLAQVRARI